MVLSRIFHETDVKGREHTNKQYIQEYEIKPFSEYVTFLTTRSREKAKDMTKEEAENLSNRLSHLTQKFAIEAEAQ